MNVSMYIWHVKMIASYELKKKRYKKKEKHFVLTLAKRWIPPQMFMSMVCCVHSTTCVADSLIRSSTNHINCCLLSSIWANSNWRPGRIWHLYDDVILQLSPNVLLVKSTLTWLPAQYSNHCSSSNQPFQYCLSLGTCVTKVASWLQ